MADLFPNVFVLLRDAPAVAAIVGVPPNMKVYHVKAKAGAMAPYVVYSFNGTAPENNLSDLPPADMHGVQVDIYGPDDAGARALARAVRDALEPHMHWQGVNVDTQETETGLWRIGFQFDYWVNR